MLEKNAFHSHLVDHNSKSLKAEMNSKQKRKTRKHAKLGRLTTPRERNKLMWSTRCNQTAKPKICGCRAGAQRMQDSRRDAQGNLGPKDLCGPSSSKCHNSQSASMARCGCLHLKSSPQDHSPGTLHVSQTPAAAFGSPGWGWHRTSLRERCARHLPSQSR